VHTGASWPYLDQVERRALGMQTTLHQWVREKTTRNRRENPPSSHVRMASARVAEPKMPFPITPQPTPTSSSTIVEHPDAQADDAHCAKVTDPTPCSRARAFSLLQRRTRTIFSLWHLALTG